MGTLGLFGFDAIVQELDTDLKALEAGTLTEADIRAECAAWGLDYDDLAARFAAAFPEV